MSNQYSTCCNLPLCICGEAYRHLNDNNLSHLAAALTALIADRMSAVHKLKHPTRVWDFSTVVEPTPAPKAVKPVSNHSLADVAKLVGIRPIYEEPQHELREAYLYPGLAKGSRFKFKEVIEGEWVVTDITYFDEDRGPSLQVASVVASNGTETMAFYTSHSNDLVDETMVPFYSMSIIENLPDRWDVVAEPAEHAYKKVQVGVIVGVAEDKGATGVFKVIGQTFYQKNFGLLDAGHTAVLATVEGPSSFTDLESNTEFKLFVIDWQPSNDDVVNLSHVHYAISHIDQLTITPAQ